MALGPNRNVEDIAKSMEERIDQAISKSAPYRDVTIALRIIPYWNREVFMRDLQHKYLNAGWRSVEVVYDQRDGDYLWFKH
jgi:hypothetical protein